MSAHTALRCTARLSAGTELDCLTHKTATTILVEVAAPVPRISVTHTIQASLRIATLAISIAASLGIGTTSAVRLAGFILAWAYYRSLTHLSWKASALVVATSGSRNAVTRTFYAQFTHRTDTGLTAKKSGRAGRIRLFHLQEVGHRRNIFGRSRTRGRTCSPNKGHQAQEKDGWSYVHGPEV